MSQRSTRSSPAPRATNASAKPRPKLLAALRKAPTSSSESETESENDVSASDVESRAVAIGAKPSPIAMPQPDAGSTSPIEESDGEGAYERQKKRLAASKNPTVRQEVNVVATVESSDDEDGMPVRAYVRPSMAKQATPASHRGSPSPGIQSQRSTPGLFVTPNASPVAKRQLRNLRDAGSESDDSTRPTQNLNIQEKVRRIRAQRMAKQQEEAEQAIQPQKAARRTINKASGSESDGENGRRLTQHAKPTRKAGKKAMEAMARDQQRISRNMQLAHQSKTKKRFTTKDLFAKLGFPVPDDAAASLPTPDASSALASSDAEVAQLQETPPASPPRVGNDSAKGMLPTETTTSRSISDEHNVPPAPSSTRSDKGKGRAPEYAHLPVQPWMRQADSLSVQNAMVELSDTDEELQIIETKSRFPVFDRVPTKKENESASLQRLRALAQLAKSPQKGRKGRKTLSLADMEFSLAHKARQQAHEAREAKIADLIRRGHHIETEEEREKRQTEIEDIVAQFEKQREEDRQLGKMEREERKKNGEVLDDLPSSDEEDGDYIGSGEENADGEEEAEDDIEAEIELSGSEDEEMEDAKDAEALDETPNTNDVVDEMAKENNELEEALQQQRIPEDADAEDEEESAPVRRQTLTRARNRVVDDDESETEELKHGSPTQRVTQEDAMAAFGFGNADAGVGLTQMFAGTMAELESDSQSAAAVPELEQNSLDFLRGLPDTQPGANFSQASDFMIPNSQSLMSPQKESQAGGDSQFSLGISQLVKASPAFSRTQVEDFEPTQDAGFSFSRSPAGLVPLPSTVDTVMMPISESPIKQKRGKLQRGRRETAVELSDVEEDVTAAEEDTSEEDDIQLPPKPRDAFSKLQKGAKKQKAIDDFNKKTSMAKDAVMEQAEESEDEYAGLGGVSDDEEGEEDQDLKDMIDHNDVNVDERQIAAFYADKAKKEDEKNIAELYKKIQTGGLRRHAAGHGFDMSDSEDEAEMRQRKKRSEFLKQTNELLKDERVKEISKDEKKKAFFNTLADFADEGDYDFLDMPADIPGAEDSQSQEEPREGEAIADVIPDSQSVDMAVMPAPINPLKRKSPGSQKENRPPPHMRRTAAADNLTRKPITLADVQNSVSELLEDSHVIVPDSQFSESEDDEETFVPSRKASVIDRLTLSRQSTFEEVKGADTNMAFHAPSRSSTAPGFRIPSLIRQATSNLSTTSQRPSGASTPTESAVRRGGTGRSNIHAQAREAERRALLDKKEGKRKEALRKKVEGGRKRAGGMRSVLGDLGGGFE